MANQRAIEEAIRKLSAPSDVRVAFLSLNGAGSVFSANGDYSSAATAFYIQPPAGEVWRVARMIAHVRDGAGGFDAGLYGNNIVVTNGIRVVKRDSSGTELVDFTPLPIKSNADWGKYCFDISLEDWGTGDDVLNVRWTFTREGSPLELKNQEQLAVILNDNLSALEDHTFRVGYTVR